MTTRTRVPNRAAVLLDLKQHKTLRRQYDTFLIVYKNLEIFIKAENM